MSTNPTIDSDYIICTRCGDLDCVQTTPGLCSDCAPNDADDWAGFIIGFGSGPPHQENSRMS